MGAGKNGDGSLGCDCGRCCDCAWALGPGFSLFTACNSISSSSSSMFTSIESPSAPYPKPPAVPPPLPLLAPPLAPPPAVAAVLAAAASFAVCRLDEGEMGEGGRAAVKALNGGGVGPRLPWPNPVPGIPGFPPVVGLGNGESRPRRPASRGGRGGKPRLRRRVASASRSP